MKTILHSWLERRRAAKAAARYEAGRAYATKAIAGGAESVSALRNHIDTDFTFGTRDEFTDGAADVLRQRVSA